jgi:NAD(P)-dependent dehydrogenase (short-subunit alcohol dehydrogenase family)
VSGLDRTRLDGRVAIITGATRNIGLATARLFADAGADLLVTSRTAETLETVAGELRQDATGRVVAIAGDVCDLAHIEQIARRALDEFGGADVIVNNAFVQMGHQPLLDTPSDIWQTGLRGYIEGPTLLARHLAPSMAERGHGAVVNVVSTAAFTPVAGLAAYGIMKAAMWASTRYLAAELAPRIRVNAVCPGTTNESADAGTNATWARVLPLVPLARMATPDETAHAVLHLASDAASYTTGDVIFVDGGRVALSGGGR